MRSNSIPFIFVFGATIAIGQSSFAGTVSLPELGPIEQLSGTWTRISHFSLVAPIAGPDVQTEDRQNIFQSGSQDTEFNLGDFEGAARVETTGEVGISAAIPLRLNGLGASGVSAAMLDTVEFDFAEGTSGLVSFSFSVDGVLTNNSNNQISGGGSANIVVAGGALSIVDVTDRPSALQVYGRAAPENSGNLVGVSRDAIYNAEEERFDVLNEVYSASGGLALVGPGLINRVTNGSYSIGIADTFLADASLTPIPFTRDLSGSFIAEAGRTYAISISSTLRVSGDVPASGDLMNTALFSFDASDDVTVLSASGRLAGTSAMTAPAAVPLPASALLLGAGLLSIARLGRRRKRVE